MDLWRSTFRAAVGGGLAAGAVAAAFTLVVVEPAIRQALTVEENRAAMEHTHETELVSRGVQQVGGAVAVIVAALLLSTLYAVALTRVRKWTKLSELSSALLVAGAGFAIFSLVPALKYPANPPAVGNPDTITERTLLYACSIAVAALTVASVVTVVRTGRRRAWTPVRLCWNIVGVVALGIVVLFVGLPASPDAIPADVAANLVWQFRLKSLGTLFLLWTTLGLVTGTALARKVDAYNRVHRALIAR